MNFVKTQSKNSIWVSIWLLVLTIMSFLIIVIGGLTRLTESGLSMVDWRPIMGIIPPISDFSWNETFENYKLTPEFKIVNKSMTIDEFKYIFWWEWFHRVFARCIGIVFLIPFIYFLFKKQISKKLFITLLILFLLGLFQAVIGWWMVKSGLNENPYVSAYRLTFHLTNALIIFSILLWTSVSSFYGKNYHNNTSFFINNFFHIGLILLFITIISGGFMAGTDAGNSFNTYPLMNERLIPEGYFIEELRWLNFFENTIAINFNHRWLATFTTIFIFSISLYIIVSKKIKVNKFPFLLILLFITLQFLLGILTLLLNVPIYLASMHQTNSTLLLASILFGYHQYRYSYLNNSSK